MQIKNQSRLLSLRFSSALGSLFHFKFSFASFEIIFGPPEYFGFVLYDTRLQNAEASAYVKTPGSLISVFFCFSADDFTLEKIIELGLDQFAEQISEVSAAASKELSIEQV